MVHSSQLMHGVAWLGVVEIFHDITPFDVYRKIRIDSLRSIRAASGLGRILPALPNLTRSTHAPIDRAVSPLNAWPASAESRPMPHDQDWPALLDIGRFSCRKRAPYLKFCARQCGTFYAPDARQAGTTDHRASHASCDARPYDFAEIALSSSRSRSCSSSRSTASSMSPARCRRRSSARPVAIASSTRSKCACSRGAYCSSCPA